MKHQTSLQGCQHGSVNVFRNQSHHKCPISQGLSGPTAVTVSALSWAPSTKDSLASTILRSGCLGGKTICLVSKDQVLWKGQKAITSMLKGRCNTGPFCKPLKRKWTKLCRYVHWKRNFNVYNWTSIYTISVFTLKRSFFTVQC